MSYPIADMLACIKNAQHAKHETVTMPSSKLKVSVAKLLERAGYIDGCEISTHEGNKNSLTISLRYYQGKGVIEMSKIVSRPGLRHYAKASKLPSVCGGLGIAIVSTSRGLMTGEEAKSNGLGGEVLMHVY